MFKFNDLRIGVRIHCITLLTITGYILLSAMSLNNLATTMREDVATKTRHLVESAHSVISEYAARAQTGELTLQQAQQQAIATLKGMRYDGEEYFWINDMHPNMIMHPFRPELSGADISQTKDPMGKALFSEMAQLVKEKGEGTVEYMWPLPGQEKPVDKISYVKGFEPWGWIVGSGVYVHAVDAIVRKELIEVSTISLLLAGGVIAIAVWIAHGISRPISQSQAVMEQLTEGNLTIDVPGLGRKDEIGKMADSIEVFRKQSLQLHEAEARSKALEEQAEAERKRLLNTMADNFERSVQQVIQEVVVSAEQMQQNARNLSRISAQAKEKTVIVAASAQETSITASAVATASEELSASILEISHQVNKSSNISQEATEMSKTIDASMQTLLAQTTRISEVTQFITVIASQINLLALNATIESARAGEAGKGFAVVAGEVKTLASQTRDATDTITTQINDIQNATAAMEHNIQDIAGVIRQMNDHITSIAAAIEEQSTATSEIARNVTESSNAADDVSRNIIIVEQGAEETSSSSVAVLECAENLSNQANALRTKVDEFLVTIRSGN